VKQYTVDEFAEELKNKYPQYKNLDNNILVEKALSKKPELEQYIIKEEITPVSSPTKYTVKEFAAKLKELHPEYASIDDKELVDKAIEKKPDIKNYIETPSLLERGKEFVGKGVEAIKGFAEKIIPQEEPMDESKKPIGATRSFEPSETIEKPEQKPEPGQIPIPQLSAEPQIKAIESRFYSIQDPRAKALELKSLPLDIGINLINKLPDDQKIAVNGELEKLLKEDKEANAFAMGILQSTLAPTFFPKETKREIEKTQQAAPIRFGAGQFAGTASQALIGAGALNKLLGKTIISKSPLLTNAITRLTTAGAIAAEQNIGRKEIGEAIGDVAQQSGGGLVSIIPEIVVPAGPLQLIAQPLGDLVYDIVSGKIRGQDVGSKRWWKNEIITLASSAGFAIRDVASGKTFEVQQQAQRNELKKLLNSGKTKEWELTPQASQRIDENIRKSLEATQTPSISKVIEAEQAEFETTTKSGIEITRNIIWSKNPNEQFKEAQKKRIWYHGDQNPGFKPHRGMWLAPTKSAAEYFGGKNITTWEVTGDLKNSLEIDYKNEKDNIVYPNAVGPEGNDASQPSLQIYDLSKIKPKIENIEKIRKPPTETELKNTSKMTGDELIKEARRLNVPFSLGAEGIKGPRSQIEKAIDIARKMENYKKSTIDVESEKVTAEVERLTKEIESKPVSPEETVEKTIRFRSDEMKNADNEMNKKSQDVSEFERAEAQRGFLQLPGEKKVVEGGEKKVAETLEAGRYESLNPIEKIKKSINATIGSIKKSFTKYESDVESYPQYRDDRRTEFDTMRRGLFETVAKYRYASLSKLFKSEGKRGVRKATDILLLRNLKLRGLKGQTLENDLNVEQVQKHLDWVEKNSSKEVLDAVEDMRTVLQGIGKELVARGKLPEAALEVDYFPHKVLDYTPEFMLGLKTPMNRKFGEPYRPYTKKAVGSKRLISSDDSVVWTHIAKVLADNAQEDWFTKQALKYDATSRVTPEERQKFYKGYETVIDGKRYKVMEWKKTRYRARAISEGLLEKAQQEDMLVKDWLETKGPFGGKSVREITAMGKPQLYLLPKEIAVDLDNLIEKSPPFMDAIYNIGHLTQKWKGFTLATAALPYQMGNIMGDGISTLVFDPHAYTYLPQSSRVAMKIFYPQGIGKNITLNSFEQKLYDVALQKDVARSGMTSELRYGILKSLSEKYKTASEYRESLMRLSILAHQLDRVDKGEAVQNLAGLNLKGLDNESAAGKVAREVLVDYLAVPRSYQLFLSRGLMPFVRFHEGNFRNYARAITRNEGTHKALKTATPILAAYAAQWAYNNLSENKKDMEMQLPDYLRERWHLNLFKNKDGNVVVWAPQQPVDMAMSWLGLDKMNKIASDMKAERITSKQAAGEFWDAIRGGAPENIGSLMNPLIQAWQGLQSNEDPFTHRKIMPDAVHREGIFSKYGKRYTIGYLGEKLITPIAQYTRTKKGGDPTKNPLLDWLTEGPFNIKRAFGIYEVNPLTQKLSEHFEVAGPIEAANEYYRTKFYDILDEYGDNVSEGLKARKDNMALTDKQQRAINDVEALVKTAKENGFEGLQLNTWFKNNTAQRKIIDSELRNTTDENKRKELIDRKKELLTGSQVEYMKKVPKTGQRKYVTEMQRRSAMPGNE